MIAKVSIINPSISGEVASQEEKGLNYELLLTTIYKGLDGKSAYEIAVEHGFEGTEEEWIASNKLVYKIVTQLPTIGDSSIFYLIENNGTYDQYVYNNGEYLFVGNTKINLDDYYTKSETFSKSETNALLSTKVDKEEGKGLSTNDFTAAEKEKLNGISVGAEVNVQSDWEEINENSSSFIKNKPFIFSGNYEDLTNKPDPDEEITETRLPKASIRNKGIVQLATSDEVRIGTNNEKAITPRGLAERLGSSVIERIQVNGETLAVNNKTVEIKIAQEGELITPDEDGVVNILGGGSNVSTPDWNQNDETATDYIKNRTHYETIAEYVEMSDEEYDAKVANGSTFVQVVKNSIISQGNEYLYEQASGTETGDANWVGFEYGMRGDWGVYKNPTSTCKKIAINGIETTLKYADVDVYPYYDEEGIYAIYGSYGGAGTSTDNFINCRGNGVIFKRYDDVWNDAKYRTLLIDKTIYGEAPYTIDFYFECEQIIKKLDEKYLPDSVWAKEPKFKTGDVVYRTDVPKFHFGVMSWEDYVNNPTNSMDTKVPIGLVVDPVKRTFLFCELLNKYFATSGNIETYFGGYTSFEDGAETFERIVELKGTSYAADIPVFYQLRNSSNPSSTVFYVKADVAYVPALNEWRKAKEHLCTAFYGDDDSYAGFMDRLIALKTGVTLSNTLFIGTIPNGPSLIFYAELSTVGKRGVGNAAFNTNGEVPSWDNPATDYVCCPVFGIYTEEEENA